jgi:phosphopantothenate-cysteine ligase
VLRTSHRSRCAGRLRSEWAPRAYIISFKLETDAALLQSKAQKALQRYGVHAVARC